MPRKKELLDKLEKLINLAKVLHPGQEQEDSLAEASLLLAELRSELEQAETQKQETKDE